MNLVDGFADISRFVTLRRDIHAHPELGFEEHRTSKIVADLLREGGSEVHTGVAGTGVVGVLKCGDGPHNSQHTIGLRADLDALPLQEENHFAHRSTHDGRMHACGHDGHTTMLLGAARYLAATRNFHGTAHLIFPLDHLIEFISFVMTLEPGDIISTGTPEGIGPIVAGDIVRVKVEPGYTAFAAGW